MVLLPVPAVRMIFLSTLKPCVARLLPVVIHTKNSMQPFARSVVVRGGQQVLRAFKPKIQASKPKNNLDFAADAIVVSRISV
jgi:hypothetical protein